MLQLVSISNKLPKDFKSRGYQNYMWQNLYPSLNIPVKIVLFQTLILGEILGKVAKIAVLTQRYESQKTLKGD